MSREVKSIELVMENCEVFKIERKHIGELHIGKIERQIGRTACNSISEDFIANEFQIQIHHNANIVMEDSNGSMFERINAYNDITRVYVNYSNGDSEWFYTDWNHENDLFNSYQSTVISEVNGCLFIVINKNTYALKEFEYEIM